MSGFGWTVSPFEFITQFPSATFTILNDYLFIYSPTTNSLVRAHTSDIFTFGTNAPYTSVPLSSQLIFSPTSLTAHRSGAQTYFLIYSSLSAAVAAWPTGKNHTKVADLTVLYEESDSLSSKKDELKPSNLKIKQAKFVPSDFYSLICLLSHDSVLKFYNASTPSQIFSLFTLPPLPSGEIYEDFDFGPPLSGSSSVFTLTNSGSLSYHVFKIVLEGRGTWNRIIWGKIHPTVFIGTEFEPAVQATSVLVWPEFPPLVVIGKTNGKFSHGLILPQIDALANNSQSAKLNRSFQEGSKSGRNLMEGSKLNKSFQEGLNKSKEACEDDSTSCDIETEMINGNVELYIKEEVVLKLNGTSKLIPDSLTKSRYGVVNECGVYLVTINFMDSVLSLCASEEEEGGRNGAELNNEGAGVRHVLHNGLNKCQNVQLSFSSSVPQRLCVGVEGGQSFIFEMAGSFKFERGGGGDEFKKGGGISPLSLNALDTVTSILSKSLNQPILTFSPSSSSGEEMEEVLLSTLRTLQSQYLLKQEEGLCFLELAMDNLKERANEMQTTLNELGREEGGLRRKAEELAEKYEEAREKQDMLIKRLEKILKRSEEKVPVLTDAERAWWRKLEEIQKEAENMREQVRGFSSTLLKSQLYEDADKSRRESGGGIKNKIGASQLLDVKKEIIEHQKALTELGQSILEINGNLGVSI